MRPDTPIPGANLLADTRHYAWHRPPDIVEYDQAVDFMIKKIDDPYETQMVMAMLKIDAQISTIVSTLLLQAVSVGKFGIDLALLTAGPLARYIEIMAKNADTPYEMGVRDKDEIVITPTLLKQALGIVDPDDEPEMPEEETPAFEQPTGGLMAMPDEAVAPQDEQMAMLGGVEEEEELEPEDELS